MNDTTKLVIATALRKMFKSGHLSICTINDCLELAGIIKGGESHKLLKTLHCVDFADMPAEVASMVPIWIADCLNGMRVDDLIHAAAPAKNYNGQHVLKHLQ